MTAADSQCASTLTTGFLGQGIIEVRYDVLLSVETACLDEPDGQELGDAFVSGEGDGVHGVLPLCGEAVRGRVPHAGGRRWREEGIRGLLRARADNRQP